MIGETASSHAVCCTCMHWLVHNWSYALSIYFELICEFCSPNTFYMESLVFQLYFGCEGGTRHGYRRLVFAACFRIDWVGSVSKEKLLGICNLIDIDWYRCLTVIPLFGVKGFFSFPTLFVGWIFMRSQRAETNWGILAWLYTFPYVGTVVVLPLCINEWLIGCCN